MKDKSPDYIAVFDNPVDLAVKVWIGKESVTSGVSCGFSFSHPY